MIIIVKGSPVCHKVVTGHEIAVLAQIKSPVAKVTKVDRTSPAFHS
jgi:hypothetical protein